VDFKESMIKRTQSRRIFGHNGRYEHKKTPWTNLWRSEVSPSRTMQILPSTKVAWRSLVLGISALCSCRELRSRPDLFISLVIAYY